MKCEYCKKDHDSSYGSGRFCTVKCARGFATKSKRKEINKKVSETFSKTRKKNYYMYICGYCDDKFISRSKNRKYCSRSCSTKKYAEYKYSTDNPNLDNLKSILSKAGRRSIEIQKETRRSKNEKYFYELCKTEWDDSIHNEPMFNGWDADVIIPSLKIAIMWNGKWHYEKITEKHSVKQVQNRDKIKQKEIEQMGYYCYIIKDMGSFNIKFVEEKFEEFKLYIHNLF